MAAAAAAAVPAPVQMVLGPWAVGWFSATVVLGPWALFHGGVSDMPPQLWWQWRRSLMGAGGLPARPVLGGGRAAVAVVPTDGGGSVVVPAGGCCRCGGLGCRCPSGVVVLQ